MNTTKTGTAAIGAVALLVVLSACAGVRGNDVEPGSFPQSQHQLQQSARQESAAMRAELHAGAASVQSFATVEGIRSAKQAEAKSFGGPSPASIEGVRGAKQAEARSDVGPSPATAQGERLAKYAAAQTASDGLRQHQLEHGASSERLR